MGKPTKPPIQTPVDDTTDGNANGATAMATVSPMPPAPRI